MTSTGKCRGKARRALALADTEHAPGTVTPEPESSTRHPATAAEAAWDGGSEGTGGSAAVAIGGAGSERGPRAPLELGAGDRVGRYQILEQIGRGGMGVVFAAYDPTLDRKVALKLLHSLPEDGTRLAIAQKRLLREAQAMAKLSHPNVVTVHEAGMIDDRGFVAMEYVKGCTLRQWCAQRSRDWQEVVEVFVRAGEGLAAAHDAGLVHRDFKPDNVLIGDDGRVRVTDFGLVRATSAVEVASAEEAGADGGGAPALTLTTKMTRQGALIGTPYYMAPEQHRGEAADARADQYAFCVSLYEALFGELPHVAESYSELVETVSSGSIRVPKRGFEVPARVRRAVLCGLAQSSAERHPSMCALIDELRREPSEARRRRVQVGAVAAVVAVLAGLSLLGLVRVGEPRASLCTDFGAKLGGVWDADRRAALERAFLGTGLASAGTVFPEVAGRLDEYTAAWVSERTDACEATHRRGEQSEAVLDLRMRCYDRRLEEAHALIDLMAAQPDAELLTRAVSSGESLAPLSQCAEVESLGSAMPLPAEPSARAQVQALEHKEAEIKALHRFEKHEAALARARSLVDEARTLDYAPVLARALFARGVAEDFVSDYAASEASLREAMVVAGAAKDDRLTAAVATRLVSVVGSGLRRFDEARRLVAVAQAAIARAGSSPKVTANLLYDFAGTLRDANEPDDAAVYYRKALAVYETLKDDPRLEVICLDALGWTLWEQNKLEEARKYFERAAATARDRLGADHPTTGEMSQNLGQLLASQEKFDPARKHLERSLAILERALGRDHLLVARGLRILGHLVERQTGNLDQARRLLERAVAICEKGSLRERDECATALIVLGLVDSEQGHARQARARFVQALAIFEEDLGPDRPEVALALVNLGDLDNAAGDHASALQRCGRSLSINEAAMGRDNSELAFDLNCLGTALLGEGRTKEARAHLERSLAQQEQAPRRPSVLAETRFLLARALWRGNGDRGRALDLARRARNDYAELGAVQQEHRVEVDRWLQRHARRGHARTP